MSNAPPISLKKLYNDLDFLGGIKDKQKYCFVGRCYVGLGWDGTFWRSWYRESQDIIGISAMESICMDACQQWDTYINHRVFGNQLLDKMVAARHGLQRCADTYYSIQKTIVCDEIKNRAILLLDNTIPYDRKVREGIVLIPDTAEDSTRQRVFSTSHRGTPETKYIEKNFGNRVSASSPAMMSNGVVEDGEYDV